MVDLDMLAAGVEAVSKQYADRYGFRRDDAWLILKLHEEVGELTQAFLAVNGQARPQGRSTEELADAFRQELSDVFGHVLLLAHRHGVDLMDELQRKWLDRLDTR